MKSFSQYLKFVFKNSKSLIFLMVVQIILKTVNILFGTILATIIINLVTTSNYSINKIVSFSMILVLIFTIIPIFIRLIQYFLNKKNLEIKEKFDLYIVSSCINMEYAKKEDPKVNEQKEKALIAMDRAGGIDTITNNLINILTAIISLISMLVILSTLKWYLFIFLFIVILINCFVNEKRNKLNYQLWDRLIPINRRLSYFVKAATKTENAKPIRLFKMEKMMENYIDKEYKNSLKYIFKVDFKISLLESTSIIVDWIMLGIIYLFLIINLNNQIIALGSFILYLNSINQFKSNSNLILETITDFKYSLKYLSEFFNFSKTYNYSTNDESIENLDLISIENLSFSYPHNSNLVIKNLSTTIKKNEKIAIVGPNGSGKTTFIKLLLGLYLPTDGKILYNGKLKKQASLVKNFSPVFQDFHLFSGNIYENLNCSDDLKIKKVFATLNFPIEKLDKKKPYETILFRNFSENGIELSMGESQKLAICRAKLKDSEIFVFDEPTASLDAIQEANIYKNFQKITENKTIIYISHRMNICTLVDRILVFNDGQIVEDGTHEQLMKNKKFYYNMFNAQSNLYNK